MVSAEHARIERVEEADPQAAAGYYIRDLNSTNGTFVNNQKIERHKLLHEDLIRVGWVTFKFIDETKADPDQTAKIHKSWIPGVYYTKQ